MRTLSHFRDQATHWLTDTKLDKTFQNKMISIHCLVPGIGMVTRSVEQAVRKVPWPSPLVTKYCNLWVAVKRKGVNQWSDMPWCAPAQNAFWNAYCQLLTWSWKKTSKTQRVFNRFELTLKFKFHTLGTLGRSESSLSWRGCRVFLHDSITGFRILPDPGTFRCRKRQIVGIQGKPKVHHANLVDTRRE